MDTILYIFYRYTDMEVCVERCLDWEQCSLSAAELTRLRIMRSWHINMGSHKQGVLKDASPSAFPLRSCGSGHPGILHSWACIHGFCARKCVFDPWMRGQEGHKALGKRIQSLWGKLVLEVVASNRVHCWHRDQLYDNLIRKEFGLNLQKDGCHSF